MAEQSLLMIIGLMVVVASALALLARKFNQPLVLGYVLAGVILGPLTGVIADAGPVVWLSEMALLFLMFVIGLQLDIGKVRDVGGVSVAIGVLEVVVVTGVGMLAGRFLGFSLIESVYIGLVITFSSTLLVAKLLEDRHEVGSLVGDIAMGVLVIEDILAVAALAILGAFSMQGTSAGIFSLNLSISPLADLALSLAIGGFIFVVLTWVLYRYVMPRLFRSVIGNPELLFVTSLAVVFLVAFLAHGTGFSVAIGSFAAGMALSSAKYGQEVVSRVRPLKDFFLTLFFVVLGAQVVFTGIAKSWVLLLVLLVGGLFLKPGVVFILLKLFKYNNYTALLTSMYLTQLSEFGLILVAAGVIAGSLSFGFLTAVVVVTIATMMLSAYLVRNDRKIYSVLRPVLSPLDSVFRTHPEEFSNVPEKYAPEVVVFGVTSVTAEIIKDLRQQRRSLLVIDYNPSRAEYYEKRHVPIICSDAIDIDLYETIDFAKAHVVISAIHDTGDTLHGPSSNTFLIRKIRAVNKEAIIIVSAQTQAQGETFYKAGATITLTPSLMGKRILRALVKERDLDRLRGIGLDFFRELHDPVWVPED